MRRQADELVELVFEQALSFAHYIQLAPHLSDSAAGRVGWQSGFFDCNPSALTAGYSHPCASVIPPLRGPLRIGLLIQLRFDSRIAGRGCPHHRPHIRGISEVAVS